jgi:predicted lactoylglutathione lyase
VFDRVTIRAADREASERFYGVVLRTLGDEQSRTDARDARWAEFTVRQADERHPPTRNLHVGFVAGTRGRVDEFWRTGTQAGYTDDGAPGPRPQYTPDYYGGFLLDPDGNSAEAVHHGDVRDRGGIVDHLWIRVADLGVSRHFHETIAPHTGFRLKSEAPGRVQFAGEGGSYSLVADTPTQHLHMAFRAAGDAAVEAFHREAVEAGYLSLESPAERIADDARGYAASIQDPDGHHIELVHHGR